MLPLMAIKGLLEQALGVGEKRVKKETKEEGER